MVEEKVVRMDVNGIRNESILVLIVVNNCIVGEGSIML